MTKSELVNAYIRGDLDRRSFIRKLTTVGVSSGAAAFYATSLAHPAVAAADHNGAGYIARAQPDEDYGLEFILENLAEVIAQILSLLDRILSRLEGVFGAAGSTSGLLGARLQGAEPDITPLVEEIRAQIGDHIDALSAMFPDSAALTTQLEEAIPQSGASEEIMAATANEYNQVVGVYAALLPNIEDLEQRQTMTEIVIVAGRHASLLNVFAGINPLPASFEQVIDPATLS